MASRSATDSSAGPANPWGFAFDHWGQLFCNDAAGNKGLSWIVPSLVRSDRHVPVQPLWKTPKGCGIDIVGTAAWPDDAQGRLILGHYFTASVRQFSIADDRSGFSLTELPPLVVDGPFAEVKEVLGGYWMIDVKSRAEAIEWATRCPAGDNETIEVRQVQEMEDFPPEVQAAAAGFADMQKQAGQRTRA